MTTRPLRLTQPEEMPVPVVDDLSATVLGEAIDTLAALRTPYWLGDSAVHLHVLASLLAQAEALLPDAVASGPRPGSDLGRDRSAARPLRLHRSTPLPAPHPHTHGDLTMHTSPPTVSPTAPAAPKARRTAAGVKADRRSPAGPGLDTGEDRRTLTQAGTTPITGTDHVHNAAIRADVPS